MLSDAASRWQRESTVSTGMTKKRNVKEVVHDSYISVLITVTLTCIAILVIADLSARKILLAAWTTNFDKGIQSPAITVLSLHIVCCLQIALVERTLVLVAIKTTDNGEHQASMALSMATLYTFGHPICK